MEKNNCSIVPYRDPADDTPNTDQILMFDDERSCLGLPEYPEIAETSSRNALLFPESSGCGDTSNVLDPNDILLDPYILEVINESNGGNRAEIPNAGSSGFNGERFGPANLDNCGIGESSGFGNPIQQRIGRANVDNCGVGQSTEFGNPIQLSVWPIPPSPYNCSCCSILREIIHTNGIHVTNLEIHGRLGIISHAVLDRYDLDLSTQNHEYQMFDFCKESIDSVKSFLIQYCKDRKREGYNMLQDPLSIFYNALCVGLHENENHNVASSAFYQSSMFSGSQQNVTSSRDAESNGVRLDRTDQQEILSQHKVERSGARAKTSLAMQRERTSKMKLKDFSGCFHLPINDAAKRMKVCPTVVKKICRQGGLSRWPHRKIKGIKRKISIKQESLNAATAEERARALADIQMLEQQLADIFAEPVSCQ